jgi:hypothetical protein
MTGQNTRSRRVQPFCPIKSLRHDRGRVRNQDLCPNHGGNRANRPDFSPKTAGTRQKNRIFRLETMEIRQNDRRIHQKRPISFQTSIQTRDCHNIYGLKRTPGPLDDLFTLCEEMADGGRNLFACTITARQNKAAGSESNS